MIESLAALQHVSIAELAGLSAVPLFAAFFFATFVSEDAACLAAGALAATGQISFAFAVASCFSGIVAGDVLLYWIGRSFGSRLLTFRFVNRFVSERAVSRGSSWLEKRGASAVFISRFVTGLRLPTYLAAGFLKTDFRMFMVYFVLAAAIWTPILVGSVALSDRFIRGSVVIASICVFVLVRIAMKLANWRNRRITLGKLKRISRWEFWPLPLFYFPVVCYILLLAIRHRSLTVFTCANPAMPSGGFVGESKNDIYSLLGADEHNKKFLLRHRLINGDWSSAEKLRFADRFLEANKLSFPVVLKPDAGERGKGVQIIDSHESLENALADLDRDHIIQEFISGDEISLFYYRFPGEPKGEIFSMTEKVFPTVTGDGASTLEELILRDDRAVCLAEKYFEENADVVNDVPADGDKVSIINIGTHSRGAIFLDGDELKTPELANAIDEICGRVHGFNFGRFDIRFSSVEDFQAGREFKIIELNGVTSESTNIYDPQYSLLDAYRILFEQWCIAFKIGVENLRHGAEPTPLKSLFRVAFANFASFA